MGEASLFFIPRADIQDELLYSYYPAAVGPPRKTHDEMIIVVFSVFLILLLGVKAKKARPPAVRLC